MGSDLSLSPSGDLLTADGATVTQQRVLRRLLSPPGAVVFHPEYGAGLPGMVGQPAQEARITGAIFEQMALEEGVGPLPTPTVSVDVQPTGVVTARVRYADQAGNTQTLAVKP